jgi:hypothetical protein
MHWFYYLPQDTIRKLTGESQKDETLLRQSLGITAENIIPAPFLLLTTQSTNIYFLVMFDFCQEKVLILGRRGLCAADFNKSYAEWESWNGDVLWRKISNALSWPGLEREPNVYETDLIPVLITTPFYQDIET